MNFPKYFLLYYYANHKYFILGHELSQKVQKTHILSNFIIIFYLKLKNTYAWQYLRSPWFKSMEKKFINWIQIHDQSPWFKPMTFFYPNPNFHWQHQNSILIGNIKTQFSLAISKAQLTLALFKIQFSLAISKLNSHWQYQKPNLRWYYLKPNFHWQHQNPILIGNIKSPTYVDTI